ncbi:hypothetical protein KGM_213293B, partial [Danaus plexippus plexippus]
CGERPLGVTPVRAPRFTCGGPERLRQLPALKVSTSNESKVPYKSKCRLVFPGVRNKGGSPANPFPLSPN